MGRSAHTAVCLGPGDHPRVLVTGGRDNHNNVLSDMWVVDVHSGRWREVSMYIDYAIIIRFWVSLTSGRVMQGCLDNVLSLSLGKGRGG